MLESGSRFRLIFENQALHALLLAVLLAGAYLLTGINGFSTGSLWGISTTGWFWLAIAIAVLHQVYVWFCWRTQLHLGLLTRRLGGRAFDVYAFFFSVIGLSRLLAVFGVAISNSHTLTFDLSALRVLAVLVLIPALYLMYSVRRYFTFRRAFGIDHFDPRGHLPLHLQRHVCVRLLRVLVPRAVVGFDRCPGGGPVQPPLYLGALLRDRAPGHAAHLRWGLNAF
jgi:hypothetical protein